MAIGKLARLLGSMALVALPAMASARQGAACGGEMGDVTSVELAGTAAGSPGSPPKADGNRELCQAGEEVAEEAAATLPHLTVGQVAVGQFADIAVLSPDERFAYVTGHQEDSIVVIDLQTLQVLHRFPVPDKVWGLAISPDGRRLLVSSTPFGSPLRNQCSGMLLRGATPSHLFILDALSGALINTLPLPAQAFALLLSPDGTRLAAVTMISVELVDLGSETVVASIAAPPGQNSIAEAAFAAGGTKIFAASGAQGVTVFDLTAGSARSLKPPPGYRLLGIGISGDPTRDLVFTTLTDSGSLDALGVIDAATEEVRVVPAPSEAIGGVLLARRLSRLFLPSAANVLDADTFGVIGALPRFYFGTGLVGQLSPDESILYVRPVSAFIDSLTLYSRPVHYDLVMIDTSSLATLAHIKLSRGPVTCTRPTPLVLGASGKVLVAPNPALRNVSIVKVCARTHPAKACE